MLEVVFMGTAPFAVPCLRALVDAGHTVKCVVSQPDRVRGRGMQLQPTPVKSAALELGLPVLQPEKASRPDFIDELMALAPQLIVVVAYGQILRPAVLEIPPLGCVNVHGSLLPELRGAAPIQWSILRGYRETGVTTMFMDAGMDTGDMLRKAVTEIRPDDTAGTLAERLAPLGAELLVRTVAEIESGTVCREPQDSERATYAPMLRKEDGAIDWSASAEEIRNRVHGCNPSPGAFAARNGEPVKVWRVEVVDGEGTPGTVLDAERLVIATGRGAIAIREIQPENRARMGSDAYQRGYRVAAGEVWGNGSILRT